MTFKKRKKKTKKQDWKGFQSHTYHGFMPNSTKISVTVSNMTVLYLPEICLTIGLGLPENYIMVSFNKKREQEEVGRWSV